MIIDEFATSTAQAATPWPAIDRTLIAETRRPPVAFPLPILPDKWRAWVEASAHAFTPVDYLAQSLLSAVAAVCGGGIVARVTPQWSEPLVLWQALVGGPSSGKSPALAAARRLLEDFEPPADDDENDDADPAPPPAIRFDDSLHALAGALRGSRRGVTLWRDELGDWLAEARQGRQRAAWLAGWSGGEAIARQTGCWPIEVPLFPLSIVGALRPEHLADTFGAGDDGLATRFLYAWPDAVACASLSDRPADDSGVRAMLRRISALAAPAGSPSTLPLSADAVARLELLLPELRRQMRDADGTEAGWIGKGAGTIVRLAGLLALMRWAERSDADELPDEVSARQLDDAHALWTGYFLPHARSVFQRAGAVDRDRTARRAARWLRRAGLAQVSREDIRCEALCRTVDAEGAEQVIERLEEGGVLRAIGPAKCLGRPKRRWEVNPALS